LIQAVKEVKRSPNPKLSEDAKAGGFLIFGRDLKRGGAMGKSLFPWGRWSGCLAFAVFATAVAFFGEAHAKDVLWGVVYSPNQRFEDVSDFGGEAVLDRETGLLWEQCPGQNLWNWQQAVFTCYEKTVGGRKGWRLPTVEELLSLGTPGNEAFLPNSEPFCGTTAIIGYWAMTTDPVDPAYAFVVQNTGVPGKTGTGSKGTTVSHAAWCVRGGPGHDSGR
jgi:hypothetical protein